MKEIKRRKAQMPTEATETAQIAIEYKEPTNTFTESESLSERKYGAFTGIYEDLAYPAMYRKAFEFHEAHNPPTVDRRYWQTHSPDEDEIAPAEIEYWEKYGRDTMAACNDFAGDPFFIGLMAAIGQELTRVYKAARQAATGRQSP